MAKGSCFLFHSWSNRSENWRQKGWVWCMPAPIHTNTREHTRHEQHLKLLCCNASRPCLAVWLPESNSQWLQPLLKAGACFLWCGCNVGLQLCSQNVKARSEVSRRMVHGLVSRISRSLPGIYSWDPKHWPKKYFIVYFLFWFFLNFRIWFEKWWKMDMIFYGIFMFF